MANVRKTQNTKPKARSTQNKQVDPPKNKEETNLKKRLGQYGAAKKQQLLAVARSVTLFLRSIPGWLKSRPAALKQWHAVDKKKKKYRSFRLQKRIKDSQASVPTARQLLRESIGWFWQQKRVIIGIFVVQVIAYVLLVRSPGSMDMSTIQDSVSELFGGTTSLQASMATIGAVIGAADGAQTNTAAISMLTLGTSLVYIWAIRQLHADKKVKVRDAYYQAFTPIIPVCLVLLVISLQLIPFAAASFVYATARSGGLFASGFEDLAVFSITTAIALLVFYWITSAVIALYVVTLPGMYPLHALRAAKKLVLFRRFTVFKRLIVLPLIVAAVYFLILLGLIRFIPSGALLFAEAFSFVVLPLIHIYLYKLYRSLL